MAPTGARRNPGLPCGRAGNRLGATAAQTLLGRSFRVTKQRGSVVESELHPRVVATVHPSSILRAPDADARRAAMESFVADLRVVAGLLG